MKTVKSDLTVAGGGIAGMCAALAAARHGLKVALVNDRPVLGGNASSEVAVSISGAAGGGRSVYAREGGLVEELKLTRLSYIQTRLHSQSYQDWPMEDAAFLDVVCAEPNVSLFLDTSVRDVEMEDGRIRAVRAVQLGSEQDFRFESPLFVDATGDGTVGFKAGAGYMWGEEAASDYGEPLAPEKASRYVMGSTLLLFSRDAGHPVAYRRPDFAYDITKLKYFKNFQNGSPARGIHREGNAFSGFWWIEIGGLLDTIADNESITMELRRLVYGVWDYIKNSGAFENTGNLLLEKVTQVAGKRESRRLIGGHVLTETEIEDKPRFPDAAAMGGWSMDVHARKGIYDEGPATHWHPNNGMYNIPFRCLYSRDVPNLMMAGRDVSCTHIALGSTRVMGTCGCEGQAVGTAAWLCRKYGEDPEKIAADRPRELQSALLRDDQTIVGVREPYGDGLTDGLTVSASSERGYENAAVCGYLPDGRYCLALPVENRLDSLEVRVANPGQSECELRAAVYTGKWPESYIPARRLKELRVPVPAGFRGWLKLETDAAAGDDRKIYLLFEKTGLLLGYGEKLVGPVTFRWEENREPARYPKTGPIWLNPIEQEICFRSVCPEQNLYAARNLVNGYSRPYGLPNLWVSAGSGVQTVRLSWDRPRKVEEIQLVFDTELEYDNFTEMMPSLVRDYTVELVSGDGSVERREVTDNALRVRRHRPSAQTLREIRLILRSTYGARDMRMYAVRLY